MQKLTRIYFLFLSTLLIIPFAFGDARTDKPNVILVLTDDQGWGDVHSNGNEKLDTPAMDRLRAEGASFDRFYVSPMCGPTRASLLTGRYNLKTGVSWVSHGKETIRLNEVTLGDVFSAAGYATGCYGKWHSGEYGPYHPNERGFDEFIGFGRGAWPNYFDAKIEKDRKPYETKGYITDALTDAAINFIERNKEKPFFCYIPYNAPHHPYQVPPKYYDKYTERGFPKTAACVYGMVENIDDNLTRIYNKLDELKLTENTIVVFLSDNGPKGKRYNGGMRGVKGEVDEGGVRVPFYIRWPGHIKAGLEFQQLAAHIDFFPTILELCNIPMPKTLPLDGISLAPLLTGRTTEWPDRMIFAHQNRFGETQMTPGSVRTDQYRLVNRDNAYELYDMNADPGQKKDIAKQFPEITKHLAESYENWYYEEVERGIQPPPTPVGFSNFPKVAIQAEDSLLHGGLKFNGRGNHGWAHAMVLDWKKTDDFVEWDIDVLQAGKYEVSLWYNCTKADVGATIQVEIGDERVSTKLTEPHVWSIPSESSDKGSVITSGPVLTRTWAPLKFDSVNLEKGLSTITVRALEIPGEIAMILKEVHVNKID